MKIINNLIPVKGFAAMAVWPFIFIRRDWHDWITENESEYRRAKYEKPIRHEKIHHAQQVEVTAVSAFILLILIAAEVLSLWYFPLSLLVYYSIYLLFWLWNLTNIGYEGAESAYRRIPFEEEAYDNADKSNYLDKRKPFAWVKYIT